MRYGEMTYEEIAAAARDGALAALATGCTEQQGPHLPVDFDSWFSETLLVEAASRLTNETRVVVLPTVPFGPTPEHRNFGAGFIDIPVDVFERYIAAVLDSLADQGFQRILVWRGCGGHDLRNVVERFNTTHERALAVLPEMPFHEIWCRVADPSTPAGHADSFTTSIVMHLRPQTLRRDRIPSGTSLAPDWSDPMLDFARYSSTGVIGSAASASAEIGARLWEGCVESVVATMRDWEGRARGE